MDTVPIVGPRVLHPAQGHGAAVQDFHQAVEVFAIPGRHSQNLGRDNLPAESVGRRAGPLE